MRMSENDARTRREHARRNGGATEYDALLGASSYARPPGARLRALLDYLFKPASPKQPAIRAKGTPHPW
jgi:hypothetical protein